MRFLIDADLPRSTAKLVERFGHTAINVRDVGLGDADDAKIAAKAQADQLCVLTGDFGFADVRNYPPHDYLGLVVFELPRHATAAAILTIAQKLLEQHELLPKLPGRLAIVSPDVCDCGRNPEARQESRPPVTRPQAMWKDWLSLQAALGVASR